MSSITTTSTKVWFVTGASSGLGKALVEHALSKGDKVSATCRKPSDLQDLASKWPSSQLLVLKLDVTSTSDIGPAFAQTVDAFGRVDIVYNNAGYSLVGEAEGTPEDVARRLFDVNFWGAINVSREAVKVFREVNKPCGGSLLQASSVVAVAGHEVIAIYSSSKFALEGWTASLVKELDPSWNVRVKIIEFGSFATRGFTSESLVEVPIHPAYDALPADSRIKQLRAWLTSNPAVEGDPAKAMREVYNIGVSNNINSLRIPLGLDTVGTIEKSLAETKAMLEETSKLSVDLKFT